MKFNSLLAKRKRIALLTGILFSVEINAQELGISISKMFTNNDELEKPNDFGF